MTALATIRGASYWSRRPVTRMDVVIGAYDDISSAEAPWVAERLLAALPGLVEHRCSIGERGGLVTRLRRGTYAPHIAEHVALELQEMIGHRAGYGRTRGAEMPGEYTVVFEHRHAGVGLRAAALALETVQRAFAGTLEGVEHALHELRAAAAEPDLPPLTRRVGCAVAGDAHRAEMRARLTRRGIFRAGEVVELSPAYLLQAGLPYARSRAAIVLDLYPRDVAPTYQEPERAERLLGVVADGLTRGGLLVAPAAARETLRAARDAGCRVALFSATGTPRLRDRESADAAAWLENGRIWYESAGGATDLGPPRDDAPVVVQLAALLTTELLPRDAERAGSDGETKQEVANAAAE
ncbi:MAG TPA: hypothetical protein VGE02_16105 [Gemmatimonadales bacterium]